MKDDIITDPKEMGYSVETAVYRHVYTYMKKYNGKVGYYKVPAFAFLYILGRQEEKSNEVE